MCIRDRDKGVAEAMELMEAQEVTVYEVDPQLFMDATESVRAKYAEGEVKAFMERIQAVSE